MLEPDNAQAHNNLGFMLAGEGMYEEAITELLRALELGYDMPSISYNNLGYIFLRKQEYERAAQFLDDALEHAEDETAILRVAFYQRNHVFIDEDPFPKTLLPVETVAYCNLATVFAEQGQIDLALEMCREAIDLSPESPLGYRAIGHLYLEMGDLEKAREAFYVALELDKENKEIHKTVEFVESLASSD